MKVIDIFGHINVCIQSCVLDLNEPFLYALVLLFTCIPVNI